jgi:hypothetical protein
LSMATVSLWIPELILEIASHLSLRADVSRFSKCDRISRELTMPLLFRKICISRIDDATSIAYVLGKYPHYARRCALFEFDGTTEHLTSDQCEPLFVSLTAVLLTLADNAHVKSVRSHDEEECTDEFPAYVWEALGKLSSSLEELRICSIQNFVSCLSFVLRSAF